MVYFMENPIEIHDLGGFTPFLETPICFNSAKIVERVPGARSLHCRKRIHAFHLSPRF